MQTTWNHLPENKFFVQPRWISRRKTNFFSLSAFPTRNSFIFGEVKIVSGKASLCSYKQWLSQAMSNGNPCAAQCTICFRWGKAGFFRALQARDNFDWTNQSNWRNSRFGSRNASVGAQPQSRIKRSLNSWTFLGFSCSSQLLRALNNMYVDGISLGRDLSFIRGVGGGGRAGAAVGRVIKFYVAKKGRVTKNLSWALGRAILFLANIAVHFKTTYEIYYLTNKSLAQ